MHTELSSSLFEVRFCLLFCFTRRWSPLIWLMAPLLDLSSIAMRSKAAFTLISWWADTSKYSHSNYFLSSSISVCNFIQEFFTISLSFMSHLRPSNMITTSSCAWCVNYLIQIWRFSNDFLFVRSKHKKAPWVSL